ncbi:ABC transporter permease [Litorihabitans aurantiacus]|uniref:ABC transporter permease n=1 Tax=Litorihabitans aurantiacus TaxID=1930061 RepID=A0AA38CTF6_9MICO|nr:ABC transporter permease subunit [Litorihabitans aurantiacus]GMA31857.1 ABC transporter permease [Litorihabitans aurantiacus]
MTARVLRRVASEALPPLALLALLLLGWQLLIVASGLPAFVLPSPSGIAQDAARYAGPIASASLTTGRNALLGLVLGAVGAVLAAVVAALVRLVDALAAPVVSALAVVPIVALAPVLYSMYGAGSEQARVIVAALAAFVPVYVTTLRGMRQVRPVHRDLMRAVAAPPARAALLVTVPTAVPFVLTGVRTASSLAVISAIVAEYFGGPRSGIGSFITTAAAGSNYTLAWAYVLGGIVVGLVFYAATSLLEVLLTRRR